MKQETNPSISSIIRCDRLANLAFRIPFIFIVVLAIMAFMQAASGGAYSYFTTEPGSVPSLVYFTAISVIIAIPLLLFRYSYFKKLFESGNLLEGKISSVFFRGRNGYIEFCFIYKGEEFKNYTSVFRHKRAMSMKEGDRVTILLLNDDPEKAHIKELLV